MALKLLPISPKPFITSECWTYYKLSIIQTLPVFDLWLANHMKIYSNQYGDAFYGDAGRLYPLSYFSEILDMEEKSIFDISSTEIIDFIIRQIDKGNYLIIDANYNKLLGRNLSSFWFHETLIYGYDTDTQEFITPLLSNQSFKETRISFQVFKDSYEDILDFYTQNKEAFFDRRSYFFPITILRPKHNYTNANACYDFVAKLRYELTGMMYTEQQYSSSGNSEETYTYCTGLPCMPYFVNIMQDLINPIGETQDKPERYCKTCLKLYENQNMLLHSMKWFTNEYVKGSKPLEELIKQYENCCNTMYNNVLLFYKYLLNRDNRIIERIINSLNQTYDIEKGLLEEMIPLITKLYTEQLYSNACTKVFS